MNRILKDNSLRKRQKYVGKIAIVGKYLYLDKILFKFFKLPFPYLKLIIVKAAANNIDK